MLRKIAERWFGVKNKQQAQHAKQRLALVYGFIGWNAFAVIFYSIMKERLPEDSAERSMYRRFLDVWFCKKKRNKNNLFFAGKTYSRLTGTSSNVHVYQVTGMTVKKEFQLIHDRLTQAEEEKQRTVTT